MKIGYTEFSFGYAFTENLIRSLATGPSTAPIFPNLVQEGQAGYDVKIDRPGLPLFFQFKLPALMVRNTAKEIAQHELSGLSVPFFRMSLMRRDLSDQHRLLIQWESKFPDAVYYATPCIENIQLFNLSYSSAKVHQDSFLFSPADIGLLPDDKTHVVAYQDGMGYGWFCSEPKEIKLHRITDVWDRMSSAFNEPVFRNLVSAVELTKKTVLESVPVQLRQSEGEIRQRIRGRRSVLPDRPEPDQRSISVAEDILVTREIARVGLGIELLFAQPR